jgi:outer membrane protein TolC
LGLKDNHTIVLEESLKSTPKQLLSTGTLNTDADVSMFELQKDQSELNLKYQKASLYPKLSMYSYIGKQYFSNDFGFANSVWNDYRYVGLNVSVPIFSGFTNKNKIKKAKIEFDIATQNYENELTKSKLDDEVLIENYLSGFKSLEVSMETYQLRKENSELVYQKYTEGLIRLEEYLVAFEEYLNAQNNYLNTLSNTYSYHATILSRQ